MKASTVYLIAFAITALSAGASRSTEHEEQHLNDLLWLKRLFGVPMLLLGAAYGYWTYLGWSDQIPRDNDELTITLIRAAGWFFWGTGLTQRIEVADASTLERIHKSWSNQHRSLRLWAGFLIVVGHTGYLLYSQGLDGLRVDLRFVEHFVNLLAK